MTGRRRGGGGAWLLAALLLVGIPVGLIHFIGWPLPRHWPTQGEWQQWLQNPLTHHTLVAMFAVSIWLLWAAMLYAVVLDVAAWARRAARRLRSLMRRLGRLPSARDLIGATVVSTGTVAVSVVATAHPPAATATIPPASGAMPAGGVNAAPADEQPATAADQVTLPGGWVAHHTAAAIAASAATVWQQRRRRYVPRPISPPPRTDTDLAPLPPTVTAITEQLQPAPDQPDPRHTGPDAQRPVPAAGQPTFGEHTGRPVRAGDLPAGGVGLTGPAALDAARGVLIAALFGIQQPDPDPRVVTTRACLATLLPAAAEYHDLPGLRVAHDLPAALTDVETIALRRANTAHDPTVPHPPVLVLVDGPSGEQTDVSRRLALVLTLAARDALHGVVIGCWPAGATWDVGPGGLTGPGHTTRGGRATRLSVLDAVAATDLLSVYCEAHARPAIPKAALAQRRDTGRSPRLPRQPDPGLRPPPAPAHPVPAPSAASQVRVMALGTPAVYPAATGDTALHLPRSAALTVLVFLALHPSGAATEDLSKALWPRLHPNTTADRVYTVIGTLKRVLNPAAGGPVVIRDGDRYRLNPHHVEVDLWQLHAAVHAAATTTDDTTRTGAFHQIVELYRGDLADGWTWSWLDPPREATRRYVVDARAALAGELDDPAGRP